MAKIVQIMTSIGSIQTMRYDLVALDSEGQLLLGQVTQDTTSGRPVVTWKTAQARHE